MDQGRTGPPTPDEPTAQLGFVWVFQYVYWDEAEQAHKTSERFATLDVIKFGTGNVIYASAKEIRRNDLMDGAFAE